jgi:hypothetical protein
VLSRAAGTPLQVMSLGMAGAVSALEQQQQQQGQGGGEPDSPGSGRTVIFHPHGRRSSLGLQAQLLPHLQARLPAHPSGLGAAGAQALRAARQAGRWLGALARGGGEEQEEVAAEGGGRPPLWPWALLVLVLALAVQVWFGVSWSYGCGVLRRGQQGQPLLQGLDADAGLPAHADYWLQHLQHLQQEMQLLQARMELVSREMQAAMGQISALAQLQQQLQQQQQVGMPP